MMWTLWCFGETGPSVFLYNRTCSAASLHQVALLYNEKALFHAPCVSPISWPQLDVLHFQCHNTCTHGLKQESDLTERTADLFHLWYERIISSDKRVYIHRPCGLLSLSVKFSIEHDYCGSGSLRIQWSVSDDALSLRLSSCLHIISLNVRYWGTLAFSGFINLKPNTLRHYE